MAAAPNVTAAFALPSPSITIPNVREGAGTKATFLAVDKHVAGLLTPPNSISPNLPAHGTHATLSSPPPITIEHEHDLDLQDAVEHANTTDQPQLHQAPATPLSKGALSGLDASEAITPAMLAELHLPGIMLGNGPRPIRYVMGELTQSVPGFSRIPPAKARRLVVAALESRNGGGSDGNVTFCKTGWGRWDAHVKDPSAKDSAIGSLQDGNLSPPRSEHSSYAVSHSGSGLQISHVRMAPGYRDVQPGASWTASSILEEREEDLDIDMDAGEHEADKMSLDDSDSDSGSTEDDTDDDDWAAVGAAALRKASLPTPGAPRKNYNALSIPLTPRWPPRHTSRRPSATSSHSWHSASVPHVWPTSAPPQSAEEQAAVEALLSMGSM